MEGKTRDKAPKYFCLEPPLAAASPIHKLSPRYGDRSIVCVSVPEDKFRTQEMKPRHCFDHDWVTEMGLFSKESGFYFPLEGFSIGRDVEDEIQKGGD